MKPGAAGQGIDAAGAAAGRARVLIVAGDPAVALAVRAGLEKSGYAVAGAPDTGELAVRAARELAPDLVLVDIRLGGGLDGIAAAVEISLDPGTPVVFLTDGADEPTLQRARAANPFGFVQAPFLERDLHLVIQMALLRSRLEEKLNEAVAESASQRRFFEALFEANPDGVLVVDAQRRVHAANQALGRLVGVPAAKLTGKRIGEVLRCPRARDGKGCGEAPGCGDCQVLAAITAALAGSEAYRNHTRLAWGADGDREQRDFLVSARSLDFRRTKLAAVILEDVTELSVLRRRVPRGEGFSGMVGRHRTMIDVFDAIRDVADSNASVLVTGESGTGKELVARAIHDASRRSARPFVPVNCGALPEGLLESELFGHVRGAFTGAVRDKKGRFELADGGTIFLDEIGDLTPLTQVKLLRVLQEGTIERVGGEQTIRVDVRVISATNKTLRAEVAAGRFRDDLFYRLCVVPINLPPLRERSDDVGLLAARFLETLAGRDGRGGGALGADALRLMREYPWPGNVRELQNALQYAVIKARGQVIGAAHLPPTLARHAEESLLQPKRGRLSRETLEAALRATGGNRLEAARRLGVSRATLYRFLSHSTD